MEEEGGGRSQRVLIYAQRSGQNNNKEKKRGLLLQLFFSESGEKEEQIAPTQLATTTTFSRAREKKHARLSLPAPPPSPHPLLLRKAPRLLPSSHMQVRTAFGRRDPPERKRGGRREKKTYVHACRPLLLYSIGLPPSTVLLGGGKQRTKVFLPPRLQNSSSRKTENKSLEGRQCPRRVCVRWAIEETYSIWSVAVGWGVQKCLRDFDLLLLLLLLLLLCATDRAMVVAAAAFSAGPPLCTVCSLSLSFSSPPPSSPPLPSM